MKTTQQQRMKDLFTARPFVWISLTEILDLKIAQYNSRLLDLRRSGMIIENKTKTVGGDKHSWFRFLPQDNSGQARFC